VRGLKAAIGACVLTIACGACTAILGDFSNGGGDGGTGAGLPDGTMPASEAGASTDSTTSGHDGASTGDDSTSSDDGGEDAGPSFAADASCEGGPCVVNVAANGDHTCALMADQTIRCWGDNQYGETLWNGATGANAFVPTPTTVPGIDGGPLGPVRTVRLGDRFTCALLVDGSVWCWGDNAFDQIGVPDAGLAGGATSPVPPTPVFPPGSVSIVYAGAYHACAMLNSDAGAGPGPIVCWGRNTWGEVGVVDAAVVAPPVPAPFTSFERMTLGAFMTCAVRSAAPFGECIGYNLYGQLGRGIPADAGPDGSGATDNLPHPTPAGVAIGNLGSYDNFPHATGYHYGTTFTDGTIALWGDNNWGQLGPQVDAGFSPTPTLVTAISDVTALGLLQYSTCVLRSDGTVWCWGYPAFGQSGNATTDAGLTPQPVPTQVTGITTATGISTGLNHACALLANGTIACWGDNVDGQLGRSTGGATFSPTPGLVQF